MELPTTLTSVPLHAIAVSGADAASFLQGQLSADLRELSPSRVIIAGCHSVQGRVQAVLTIVQRPEAILLITSAALGDRVISRLRPFVLRAKVSLQPGGGSYCLAADMRGEGAARDLHPGEHLLLDDVSIVRPAVGSRRELYVIPDSRSELPDGEVDWRLADIRAGLPNIFPPTWESFVSQTLNLDLLGAISFDKGCYTGQEVIARAHYRGAVKRRMLRFEATGSAPEPGSRVLAHGGHAGDVVDAADVPGGCEMLAVISLEKLALPLALENGAGLRRLELPYPIAGGG